MRQKEVHLWMTAANPVWLKLLKMKYFSVFRWSKAGRGRRLPRGDTLPATWLFAALAVPGGPSGRSRKFPFYRLDWPRHGVQTHWTRRGWSEFWNHIWTEELEKSGTVLSTLGIIHNFWQYELKLMHLSLTARNSTKN